MIARFGAVFFVDLRDFDVQLRVVERSRTRQSLDLPRRSPNSGEFGYEKSFTACPTVR